MNRAPFLDGGGRMAEAIRVFDWSPTPLGRIEDWPSALKTAVGMMVNSRFPKCIFWGADFVTIYNDAYRPMLGEKPEALGRFFRDVWPEVWPELEPVARKALAGEATFVEDYPLVINRFGRPEQTWFTFCYSPIRDETGMVVGIIDTVIETTGKVQAERSARLLNAELAHRMKNTLAMIGAVASQTFRSAESLDAARESFAERLAALGEAHDILTSSSWSSASVAAVVEGALRPHRPAGGRIVLSGPPVELSARQSLTLALTVNELATNAVKYGALSNETGQVTITWSAGRPDSDDTFGFSWAESGGPAVQAPSRKGFGSRLIERVVAQDFGAKVSLTYAEAGLRYEFTAPMANIAVKA